MEIGQEVLWHKIVSNYGHISVRRGVVRKIGKRITIEVKQMDGGSRLTVVRLENLRPIHDRPEVVLDTGGGCD